MITEATARCPDCGSPAVITMTLRPIDGSLPIGRSKIGMKVDTTHTVVCDHADACPRPEIEDNNCDPWFRNPFSRAAAAELEADRRECSPFHRKPLLGTAWQGPAKRRQRA
ncbi:hypothetical protein [Tardiphaga sp.]|jgi:hypothetical protein|uniref:hypothetical protein n=1 Tax=Tardiphaga sp. TaxID=1926292 RepID=UPI0037DA6C21